MGGLGSIGYTVNVDIFARINCRAFPKISNSAQILFLTFFILMPLCSIIQVIFTMNIFSQTFDKRE